MVKSEYPDGCSIPQIVREWGRDCGLTQLDITAVERLAPLFRD
jgi:hypothetical protein